MTARNTATTSSPRDGPMGGAGEQVAGVVIEPVEDLHVGPVGQAPVDEVRLPHLVRLGHLKARVGRAGALARLRGDQPGLRAGSGGSSRSTAPAAPLARGARRSSPARRPAHRRSAGARSSITRSTDRLRRRDRRCLRAARARLERVQATLSVAGEEAVQMPAGDPVLGSSRGDRQLLGNDLEDSNTSSGHARDCQPHPRTSRARRSPLRPRPPGSRLRDDRRNPLSRPRV